MEPRLPSFHTGFWPLWAGSLDGENARFKIGHACVETGVFKTLELRKAVAVSEEKIQQRSRRRGRFSSSQFSLPENAKTSVGTAFCTAGKSVKNFPAASKFAGKLFQQRISDSHSLLEFSDFKTLACGNVVGLLENKGGRRVLRARVGRMLVSKLRQDPPNPPQWTVLASRTQGFTQTLRLVQNPVNGRQTPQSAWSKPPILLISLFCVGFGASRYKMGRLDSKPPTLHKPCPLWGVRRVLVCKSLGHLQNRKTPKSRKWEKNRENIGNPIFCLFLILFFLYFRPIFLQFSGFGGFSIL